MHMLMCKQATSLAVIGATSVASAAMGAILM